MGGEHWRVDVWDEWAGAAADGLLVKFIETHAILLPSLETEFWYCATVCSIESNSTATVHSKD